MVGAALALPGPGRAAVSNPVVSGPITGGLHGHPLFDSWWNPAEVGYVQEEYFVSGTATALGSAQSAPYTTRMVVSRPSSPDRFNGSVLLDWTNVTGQFENAVDTLEGRQLLVREGWAFVHVSAQAAGICCTPLTPKVWDPVRYAPLSHPGDQYSYDIFSQVARAVRAPTGVDPMGGLHVQKEVAAGQSQSADYLDTYVRQAQPGAGVIDGFLIHGGGSKTWATPPAVPVLHLLADTEASPAGPSTSTNYRLWEIAGTSHSDFWIGYEQEVGQGPRALTDRPQQAYSAEQDLNVTAGNYGEVVHPMDATCILAGATFPMRYAVSTALHDLNAWVRNPLDAPANGPRFQFNGALAAQDSHGNTLGGVRLPPIDVPVAHYVSTACGLGGLTVPFTDAELHALYPTHAAYYGQMVTKTNPALTAGWLLSPDGQDLLARACAAKVRWQEAPSPCP